MYVFSGTYIHPLLFDGQAVIVGVGRVQRLPRFVEREMPDGIESALEARDIINCSFSADHRHCDGATITRFSRRQVKCPYSRPFVWSNSSECFTYLILIMLLRLEFCLARLLLLLCVHAHRSVSRSCWKTQS